jgi:hypothetical protein
LPAPDSAVFLVVGQERARKTTSHPESVSLGIADLIYSKTPQFDDLDSAREGFRGLSGQFG